MTDKENNGIECERIDTKLCSKTCPIYSQCINKEKVLTDKEIKGYKQKLYCDNCPERQKIRCQERKQDFKEGYEWLESYVKNNCRDYADTILKQINSLKIYPNRCDYVLEQQLLATQKKLEDVKNENIRIRIFEGLAEQRLINYNELKEENADLQQKLDNVKEENEKLNQIIKERLSGEKIEVVDAKVAVENVELKLKLDKAEAENKLMKEALENIFKEVRKRLIKGNIAIKDLNINHWCLTGLQIGGFKAKTTLEEIGTTNAS